MESKLKLSFAGDLCLQGVDTGAYEIDIEILKNFQRSDLSIVNLESPLTDCSIKLPAQPCHLKGEPVFNQILDMFDIFSLANNHVLDYTNKGLADTCNFLLSQGKKWFGVGNNRAEAYRPLCIEKNNFRVAFIGCTRWYNAGKRTPGTTPMNTKKMLEIIKRLKKDCYFVIIFPHWNYEYVNYPSPVDRRRAHQWINAGADLVVGSHPHQIQGIEQYRNRYIFHSLGNFIFNIFDLSQPRFAQTFIPTVTILPNYEYTVELQSVFSTPLGLFPLDGSEKEKFDRKLHCLSRNLGDKYLHKRLFYESSSAILRNTMASFDSASGHHSRLFTIFKRLPRIQCQDVCIKYYSLLNRFYR